MSQAGPGTLKVGAGLAEHADAVTAAERACDAVLASLGDGPDPDLAIVFVSFQHADLMGAIGDVAHRRLSPGVMLAVSAEAVVGGSIELEGAPGVSMLALRMPGVAVRPFTSEDLPVGEGEEAAAEKIATALNVGSDLRAVLLFADPFSVPLVKLLPSMSRMCRLLGVRRAPIVGGMASAGSTPGSNGLVINKRLSRTGAIGVTLRGDIAVDTLVSQGCKPFGPPLVVTGARHNVVFSLSGQPALQALHEAIEALAPEDRRLLERGVFLGRVVNEYKDRFGRGDYLIRNVVGVDQSRSALAVADMLRVGQTVRFHLRDAVTADEDLRLLLAAQRLRDPALGVLLCTCNGRGTRLFESKHHDASLISDALAEETGVRPPLAGFFAAGEIGPIGDEAFIHGQTASAAIFRSRGQAED